MLRRRSRGVSSKQGPMTEHSSTTSPIPEHSKPATNPLFPSPRLFVDFSPKCTSDCEATMSPTSILENKTLASVVNPFFSDKNPRKALLMSAIETRHHHWDSGDSKAVGLGIVDALKNDGINDKSSKPERSMVLFGSQLRIQIPNPISPNVSFDSPRSPIEFGIKTKNSQLALLSPVRRSPMGSGNFGAEVMAPSPRVVTGQLSKTEMELSRSEDYTCVISHGPNPRTTHIFDTCDIKCCSNGFTASRTEDRFVDDRTGHCSDDILSFCHACKKSLDQGEDIFVYSLYPRGKYSLDQLCKEYHFSDCDSRALVLSRFNDKDGQPQLFLESMSWVQNSIARLWTLHCSWGPLGVSDWWVDFQSPGRCCSWSSLELISIMGNMTDLMPLV